MGSVEVASPEQHGGTASVPAYAGNEGSATPAVARESDARALGRVAQNEPAAAVARTLAFGGVAVTRSAKMTSSNYDNPVASSRAAPLAGELK
jgi:hypothetical protein